MEHCEYTLEYLEIQAAVENAKTAAEEAQLKADAAKAEAEAAKNAAEAAQAAAEAAQASSAQDKQAAEEAKAESETAQAAAEEAQAKAQEEQEKAEAAQVEAEKASEEAKAAQAKAEAAQAAAELATAKQMVILELTIYANSVNTEEMGPYQQAAYEEVMKKSIEAVNEAENPETLENIVSNMKAEVEAIGNRATAERFVDVTADNWFYDVVDYVAFYGIMTGTDEMHFKPMESLTRAQFATILYRLEGSPEVTTEKSFKDVLEGKWFEKAVLWAAEEGIVNGYTQTETFEPTNPVTREQMVVMMHRYAKYLGKATPTEGDLELFEDAQTVSGYAKEAMQWATGMGIISGKNGTNLDPKGTTTRGAAAAVVQRFMEAYAE